MLGCLGSLTTWLVIAGNLTPAAHPLAAQKITGLTNPAVKFSISDRHLAVLKRGPVTAVIVDNEAVDVPECPAHRSGYNGVAVLTHEKLGRTLFVPEVGGLNFEFIHDGTAIINSRERYEPAQAPMQLRIVDDRTVELHQPPTPNFKLESCGRYRLLDDGTIEYTFECIPREATFAQGYIGLFWASYIHQPESGTIHFIGRKASGDEPPGWIEARSPTHGIDSTHPPMNLAFEPKFTADFSVGLANHRSPFVYTEPWYYGVSEGIAYVQMFRLRDSIWLAQSPTGGGGARNRPNPAWDFQWYIPDYKVGEAYGFTMCAAAIPFTDRAAPIEATRANREALK